MSGLTVEQIMALAQAGTDVAPAAKGRARDLPKVRIDMMSTTGELSYIATVTVQYSGLLLKSAFTKLGNPAGLSDDAKKDLVAQIEGFPQLIVRHQFEGEVDTSKVTTGSLAEMQAKLAGGVA